METRYQCANCEKHLFYFAEVFLCLYCGMAFTPNSLAHCYRVWRWCEVCNCELTVVKRYEKLKFLYCPKCGEAYYHKEVVIC